MMGRVGIPGADKKGNGSGASSPGASSSRAASPGPAPGAGWDQLAYSELRAASSLREYVVAYLANHGRKPIASIPAAASLEIQTELSTKYGNMERFLEAHEDVFRVDKSTGTVRLADMGPVVAAAQARVSEMEATVEASESAAARASAASTSQIQALEREAASLREQLSTWLEFWQTTVASAPSSEDAAVSAAAASAFGSKSGQPLPSFFSS